MFDLPMMIIVMICVLVAWDRSRREDNDEP